MKRVFFLFLLCIALALSPTAAFASEDFIWDVSKQSILAGLMEADISSIQAAYKAGILTCREVTQYYLERISAYNDSYNCFISLCDDALEQAEHIDARIACADMQGLLFGIPLVIKDNMDYAGYHTTNGYTKQRKDIAERNARIVDYLLQEGAVILGKTNMSTAAQDAQACYSQAVGETKNAYGLNLASGGSSGGSAVATSLNFAVAGLGTDTNSSLRFPAVLNGCISLRVTWDSLSMDGIIDLNDRRDVPGCITRSVLDQAILLDALSGGKTSYAEHLDSTVLDGLRLGVIEELTYPGGSENREVLSVFEAAIAELESCGAKTVPVSIPDVEHWYYIYNDSEAFRSKALAQLEQVMEENNISAFLFPTYLSAPQYSGRDESGVYRSPWDQLFLNNTSKLSPNVGIPEIGIPIGYHSRGAAIGMEIAAGMHEEQLLLNIAFAYTQAYDHRQAPQEAPDLYATSYQGSLSELTEDYYSALSEYHAASTATQAPPTTTAATEESFPPPPPPTAEPSTEAPPLPAEEQEDRTWILFVAIPLCALLLLIPLGVKQKRRKTADSTQ